MKKIPKIIYLTYKTKDIPSNIIPTWQKLNPDYKVELYDDLDCINFLLDNYGQKYVDIFNYIEDGPIKSDFFRVCLLYKCGGIYSDIDIEPLVPINDFIEDNVDFVTCSNPQFICCKKNNDIIKSCVDKYVEKYDKKDKYSYWNWSILNILKPYIAEKIGKIKNESYLTKDKNDNTYQIIKEVNPKNNKPFRRHNLYCEYNGKKIFRSKTNNYIKHEFIIIDKNKGYMDIVYPHHYIPTGFNLKHSIKSVQNNLLNHGNIFVIAQNMNVSVKDAILIYHSDKHNNNEKNIIDKILKACNTPEISDDFVLMNDDFYFLEQHDIKDLKNLYLNDLDFLIEKTGSKSYKQALINTKELLLSKNLPTLNFDTHHPMIINKAKFLELFNNIKWEKNNLLYRSTYGNYHNPVELKAIKKDCVINSTEGLKGKKFVSAVHALSYNYQFEKELINKINK